jgi:radical SAM protein with 4Fe4S-binding SPASM domain
MLNSSANTFLSWEDLIYLADFFQKYNEKRFQILGGEPTLHPHFNDFVLYLLERDFHLTIFTSGIIENRKLREATLLFRNVHPERLRFVCNLNDPSTTKVALAEQETVRKFLSAFGDLIVPGFNIYRKDFSLKFLFDYVLEFGLHKTIRVGLAHPIPGQKNVCIKAEEYEFILDRFFSYIPLFERFRVKPGFDCGFPMCKIKDEHLAWMYRFCGGRYDFGCAPVIDIGPDMMVWSCFPLSFYHKRSVFEFKSIQEIVDYYFKLHESIRVEASGIYKECDSCQYREDNLCKGGCLAHNLINFINEAPVRMPEVYI